MTWLEFETDSGRIVCEVKSGGTPSVMEGHEVIPAPEGWDGDLFGWAVENGTLTRVRSTELERLEAERARGAQSRRARQQLKMLICQYVLMLMDEDERKCAELRAEFKRLKALL